MTQEQIEYDEEQYRIFDTSLESLIGKVYSFTDKTGNTITVKNTDKESLDITFRYDGKSINTVSCLVDTKFDFSFYNILNIAVYELLCELKDSSILMRFLINFKDLEINLK